LRIINVPGRGIGEKTMLSLTMAARQAHISLGQVLLDLGRNGDASPFWKDLSGRGAVMLADFGVLLGSWVEQRDKLSLPALFGRILQDVVYQEYIQDHSEEGEDRWGNVQELLKLAGSAGCPHAAHITCRQRVGVPAGIHYRIRRRHSASQPIA